MGQSESSSPQQPQQHQQQRQRSHAEESYRNEEPLPRRSAAVKPADPYAVRAASGPPTLHGFASKEDRMTKGVLSLEMAAAVAAALPPALAPSGSDGVNWYLLYNSNIHGRSFHRLVQRATDKGPTVVVIRDGDSKRVFGGFCSSSWLTVASREKRSRSDAAARSRASRMEGAARPSSPSSSSAGGNQAPQFFGDEKCFLFTNNTAQGDDVVTIYHSKASVNSNFMYLFDVHPIDKKIGMGMGGRPDFYGWFVDGWLEHGYCYGAKCSTYNNPMLSLVEQWPVDALEVYAVDPAVVATLIAQQTSLEEEAENSKTVLQRNPDLEADKMIMELNGMHKFDQHDRPEC